jgi:HlyD family secretion protein
LWLTGILLVAAGAGFILWKPTGGNASDQAYRLGAVDRGSITASVRATGTLNPVTTVLVGSQLSGQVVEILADYNTPVKEGQVVARIYSEQIKSRRDAALADLAQARADLDRSTKRARACSVQRRRPTTWRRSATGPRRSWTRRSAISSGRRSLTPAP